MSLISSALPAFRWWRRAPSPDSLVLPHPPTDVEKYSYIDRHLPYLATIMAIGFVAATISQVWFEMTSGWWEFAVFTFASTMSFGLALPLSFLGRGFNLDEHSARVASWCPIHYPEIDIFLPICNEPLPILQNTWMGVAELVRSYPGRANVFVLDDGEDPAARPLAESFHFRHIARPDRGVHKKSGNLRYGFANTSGEFIVVLDADFIPRPDFLTELLPYLDDPEVAIVQSPQFFRPHSRQTWVERAAGAVQEVFYRSIQVSRDRLGASICVGSCALYRRTALEAEGGTTLIAYAEDVHTGLDARRNGWKLFYVPLALTTGICPNNLDAFVRQQYRWCTGSTSTVLTSRLWTVPMSVRARLTYLSGFFYYVQTGLATFAVPLIPICLLGFRPRVITVENSRLILVALAASAILVPIWNVGSYKAREVVPLSSARGWAHALAIWDYLRGKTMAWQATGAGVSSVRRFHWGLTLWNGVIALAWLCLAVWRTLEYHSSSYVIVILLGLAFTASTARLLWTISAEQRTKRWAAAAHAARRSNVVGHLEEERSPSRDSTLRISHVRKAHLRRSPVRKALALCFASRRIRRKDRRVNGSGVNSSPVQLSLPR